MKVKPEWADVPEEQKSWRIDPTIIPKNELNTIERFVISLHNKLEDPQITQKEIDGRLCISLRNHPK